MSANMFLIHLQHSQTIQQNLEIIIKHFNLEKKERDGGGGGGGGGREREFKLENFILQELSFRFIQKPV